MSDAMKCIEELTECYVHKLKAMVEEANEHTLIASREATLWVVHKFWRPEDDPRDFGMWVSVDPLELVREITEVLEDDHNIFELAEIFALLGIAAGNKEDTTPAQVAEAKRELWYTYAMDIAVIPLEAVLDV